MQCVSMIVGRTHVNVSTGRGLGWCVCTGAGESVTLQTTKNAATEGGDWGKGAKIVKCTLYMFL